MNGTLDRGHLFAGACGDFCATSVVGGQRKKTPKNGVRQDKKNDVG